MRRRHPVLPTAWLITDTRIAPGLLPLVRRLPQGTGVLVRHHELPVRERAALLKAIRRIARTSGLVVVDEADGQVARVHSAREIARARLAGATILFISPLYVTRSHPGWRPLPRMRAAALARLAGNQPLALGGMNARRFRQLAPMGFGGWGAIDGWAPPARPSRE